MKNKVYFVLQLVLVVAVTVLVAGVLISNGLLDVNKVLTNVGLRAPLLDPVVVERSIPNQTNYVVEAYTPVPPPLTLQQAQGMNVIPENLPPRPSPTAAVIFNTKLPGPLPEIKITDPRKTQFGVKVSTPTLAKMWGADRIGMYGNQVYSPVRKSSGGFLVFDQQIETTRDVGVFAVSRQRLLTAKQLAQAEFQYDLTTDGMTNSVLVSNWRGKWVLADPTSAFAYDPNGIYGMTSFWDATTFPPSFKGENKSGFGEVILNSSRAIMIAGGEQDLEAHLAVRDNLIRAGLYTLARENVQKERVAETCMTFLNMSVDGKKVVLASDIKASCESGTLPNGLTVIWERVDYGSKQCGESGKPDCDW